MVAFLGKLPFLWHLVNKNMTNEPLCIIVNTLVRSCDACGVNLMLHACMAVLFFPLFTEMISSQPHTRFP